MSTNSHIGLWNEESNRIDYIYCHWDGYPDWNGKILTEFYSDTNKVRELISHGDLSSLCSNINPKTDKHSFDTPEDDVCTFYHRDRGEPLEIRYDHGIDEFLDVNYAYLWTGKEWRFFCEGSEIKNMFQRLSDGIELKESQNFRKLDVVRDNVKYIYEIHFDCSGKFLSDRLYHADTNLVTSRELLKKIRKEAKKFLTGTLGNKTYSYPSLKQYNFSQWKFDKYIIIYSETNITNHRCNMTEKKEVKRWLSNWDRCDICKEKIKGNSEWFVDGKTVFGPWALMCERCFEEHGVGLGLGRGQKYDGKTAVLIEG